LRPLPPPRRPLHPFPTRRSSDLDGHDRMQAPGLDVFRSFDWIRLAPPGVDGLAGRNFRLPVSVPGRFTLPDNSSVVGLELLESRSEEHTSVLQSRSDLVCRHLLE